MNLRFIFRTISLSVVAISFLFPSGAYASQPLSLQECIDLALKNNLKVKSAAEKKKDAEAQKAEALTNFLPKFSTSYSYTRLNEAPSVTTPSYALSLPAPIGSINIPSNTVIAGTEDNYNWSIDAKQPIFMGGAITANYEIQKLGLQISHLEEKIAIQDTILDVTTAYFNILKAKKLRELAVQSVEQLAAHKNTAQNFYDAGLIPRNDLLRAEVELANGKQLLAKSDNGLQMANAGLNMILHADINSPVDIQDILTYLQWHESMEQCIKKALDNRTEIKIYGLKVDQAKQAVRIARSEYFPTVSVAGNYTRFGDTAVVSGSSYKDQESWYIMAMANWTFWEWGKTKNKVTAGISRENQMAYSLAALRDQIQIEVKNAYLEFAEAEKQILTAEKSIEQADENFRITKERYQEQMATTTDVIDAQTLLLKAKSDYTNALGNHNIGQAKLKRSMGIIDLLIAD